MAARRGCPIRLTPRLFSSSGRAEARPWPPERTRRIVDTLSSLLSLAPEQAAAASADLFSVASLISLLTLVSLEIVLGIDNVIFIAILAGKLPHAQQASARRLGISLAVITRVLLLLGISWVMQLTRPLFSVGGFGVSGKQLILFGGGLFLIAKSTYEIHDKLEAADKSTAGLASRAAFGAVIAQIVMIDIVFSLDSVITAVGMVSHIPIMIVAVLVAAVVMLVFASPISDFVHRHPTMKMLALAFLILIGVLLIAEGAGQHFDRGYIYFAMAFSFVVELLNMRLRARTAPVELRHSQMPAAGE
jgi:predicted tellurium resistance membrane protein TerC